MPENNGGCVSREHCGASAGHTLVLVIFTWKNRISRDEQCLKSRTDPNYQASMNREGVSLG